MTFGLIYRLFVSFVNFFDDVCVFLFYVYISNDFLLTVFGKVGDKGRVIDTGRGIRWFGAVCGACGGQVLCSWG